ncbi:MAG: PilZ domain-containing protein [Hyphomicrobiaceae bacterium]
MTSADVDDNEAVVAYFDALGSIEGQVRRRFEGGFTLSIDASLPKRQRLASRLTWLINRHELDALNGRRFERVSSDEMNIIITVDDKELVDAKVIDVSLSGASIVSDLRPQIGSLVSLGKYRGQVMRHHETGFGIEFIDVDASKMLTRHFS